jgi:hypothetical protein
MARVCSIAVLCAAAVLECSVADRLGGFDSPAVENNAILTECYGPRDAAGSMTKTLGVAQAAATTGGTVADMTSAVVPPPASVLVPLEPAVADADPAEHAAVDVSITAAPAHPRSAQSTPAPGSISVPQATTAEHFPAAPAVTFVGERASINSESPQATTGGFAAEVSDEPGSDSPPRRAAENGVQLVLFTSDPQTFNYPQFLLPRRPPTRCR